MTHSPVAVADQAGAAAPADDIAREPFRRRAVRVLRRLGPAGPLALAAAVVPLIGAAVLFGSLKAVSPWLRERAWGPVICFIAFSLLGGIAVLPTAAMSIFAGWTFDFARGYPVVMGAFVAAAAVNYEISRRASGTRVAAFLDENTRWRAIHRSLLHSGSLRTFSIVALLRLPSAPPFGITNVAMGALHVKRWPFVLGTLVGIAPRTAAYVMLGGKAQGVDMQNIEDGGLFLIWLVVTLAVVAIITLIARRALARMTRQDAVDRESAEPPVV